MKDCSETMLQVMWAQASCGHSCRRLLWSHSRWQFWFTTRLTAWLATWLTTRLTLLLWLTRCIFSHAFHDTILANWTFGHIMKIKSVKRKALKWSEDVFILTGLQNFPNLWILPRNNARYQILACCICIWLCHIENSTRLVLNMKKKSPRSCKKRL